ncbi:hypothetical protein CC86DRAFT_369698 [Ophiobolus disseminans]|uniref:Uncharacterized protein n=1 Tax=Ophiobolus disseminans TaxID=1469910 RepID=A0A6A7A457_9PLEO|nr:hypothetical protein CC86DRAFT_369698 [Ophiobolus disseminans]
MSFLSSVGSLFGWFPGHSQPSGDFTPSYNDVCQARAILKTLDLPTELVLQILDHSEYWPQHIFVTSPDQPTVAQAAGFQSSEACLCLDAGIFNNPAVDPIRKGGEIPKIHSIEFEVVSKDQGWTSENTHNTYSTSSWLETSIMRTDNPDNMRLPSPSTHLFGQSSAVQTFEDPSDFHSWVADRGWYLVKRPESAEQGPQGGEGDFAWYLQGNRVAAGRDGYKVVWARDGVEGNEGAGTGKGFLEELKEGDRLLVWARAKWTGWRCVVESVKVTVRYGF